MNWLKLWRPLSRWLVDHRQPVILDVVFHVELETLPDEFVVDELSGKLPLIATYPSHVVSNDVWDVKVRPVDFERAAAHLSRYYVKCLSDQMVELIGGRRDPNRGLPVYTAEGPPHSVPAMCSTDFSTRWISLPALSGTAMRSGP